MFLEGHAGIERKPKKPSFRDAPGCLADGEDHQQPAVGEEKWAGGGTVP